jgi:hypothetical protein
MADTLYKLQPDRTMYLRGFSDLGAGAAIHDATPTGFQVSGVFRDPADFAVVVLWDADDFFNHPTLKYLPDTNFAGLTLEFDVTYTNLMPLNCAKYPTIDWPYLDVQFPDGTSRQIRLSDYAQTIANSDPVASGTLEITGANLQPYDRLTLWYLNIAYDYIVPGQTSWSVQFYIDAPGKTYTITVDTRSYSYTITGTDTAASLVEALVGAINAGSGDPEIAASAGAQPGQIILSTRLSTGGTVTVSATDNGQLVLYHVTAETVAAALAEQINGADYAKAQAPFALQAAASGTSLTIATTTGGYDADFITLLAVNKTATLTAAPAALPLTGGDSRATLHVTLDFSALGLTEVQQMWLTLAPRLANGSLMGMQEWKAKFENWTVSGPQAVQQLQVPGPASHWIGCTDRACAYAGQWALEDGFYLGGQGQLGQAGAAVTISYYCGYQHDVWLATEFNATGGNMQPSLDGVAAPAALNTNGGGAPITARRLLFAGVAAGAHSVKLTVVDGTLLVDHLIASVPTTDVPSMVAQTDLSAAFDYSTDHTYKLPPARILWLLNKLGLRGPVNQYIGVFWWNQRTCIGNAPGTAQVSFGGSFVEGDTIFLNIGGQSCGKTVFGPDTPATIAQHFADFINAIYVGVWAVASGTVLTINNRSAAPAYSYVLTPSTVLLAGSTGTVSASGSLKTGVAGTWQVDPTQDPPLNAGARAWHTDFYAQCAAAGLEVTSACSMELVNPPAGYAAVFADGTPVLTAEGFANLVSTQCAFSAEMQSYQERVFTWLAQTQAAAGLVPALQCGEFTWWYFTDYAAANPGGGMAYYDAETAAAAQAALGRPLAVFRTPNDDPGVNGGADATFLRNRLRDYCGAITTAVKAAVAGTRFEILFPDDVNYPTPTGIHSLGGQLNRFVNLPPEWSQPGGSGFDRFKLEALDFGAWCRDTDLAEQCQQLPIELGWPPSLVSCITPVFRPSYAWMKEVGNARQLKLRAITLWAFDHVNLYGLALAVSRARHAFYIK